MSVEAAPWLASIGKAVDSTGQPLQPPQSWSEARKFTSTTTPANLGGGVDETEIQLGDFSNVLVGTRSQVRFGC